MPENPSPVTANSMLHKWKKPCIMYAYLSDDWRVEGMECKIKTDVGTIFISEDVLLKVVGYAALECYGIVAMSSKRAKDGIVEWLGRENLSKGVQIRMVEDQLSVDLYIVVEYGVSVAEVCKTIVEVVKYKLESMTGVKVRGVNISVEGIRV